MCMHFNGLKLSGALEEISITSQFWAQKCKNQILKENKGFECIFFRIEVQVISNPSSRLEPPPHPTKPLNVCL